MKKLLSVICGVLLVGILAISFTSCSKEDNTEVEPEIKSLKFNITVNTKSSFTGETKAVKTGWASGDKMYVFFNVTTPSTGHLDAIHYLTLTYNGTSWDGTIEAGSSLVASEIGTAGTMYGIYFPFGDVAIATDGGTGVTFKTAGNTDPSLNGQPIYTYYMTGETLYTVATEGNIGTLTGSFTMEIPDNYVYFFMNANGEQYSSNEKYRLYVSGLNPAACTSFSSGSFNQTEVETGGTVWGYTYGTAGIAFSGKINSTWSTAKDHCFMLYTGNDPTPLSNTINNTLASHKSVNLNMSSASWKKCGFRGFEVSPGVLKRNTDGTYVLTPGTDPFEMYTIYDLTSSEKLAHYYLTFESLKSELGASGTNIVITPNAHTATLPTGWKFPTNDDWITIYNGTPLSQIKIGDAVVNKAYALVRYNGKMGLVLLRDGVKLESGVLSNWGNVTINDLTDAQYNALLSSGCLILAYTGFYTGNKWKFEDARYWSGTSDGTYFHCFTFDKYAVGTSNSTTTTLCYPSRLVKAI